VKDAQYPPLLDPRLVGKPV